MLLLPDFCASQESAVLSCMLVRYLLSALRVQQYDLVKRMHEDVQLCLLHPLFSLPSVLCGPYYVVTS